MNMVSALWVHETNRLQQGGAAAKKINRGNARIAGIDSDAANISPDGRGWCTDDAHVGKPEDS